MKAVLNWLMGADKGASSETMLRAALGKPSSSDTPKDAHDFGRCFRMLRRVEADLSREHILTAVAEAHPYAWGPLVERWDELGQLYLTDRAELTEALGAINWACRRCQARVCYMTCCPCGCGRMICEPCERAVRAGHHDRPPVWSRGWHEARSGRG